MVTCLKPNFVIFYSAVGYVKQLHCPDTFEHPGVILDNISIFSEKQGRFLRSDEWAPNKLFEAEDDDIATGVKSVEEDPKPTPDAKPEEAKDDKANKADKVDKADKAEAEKDAVGGWTFTIRERPMPDPVTGKKRRKGAEDSEAVPTSQLKCRCGRGKGRA